MAYDDTSYYGDLICDEYDEQNNFINPPSPTGYYIYHILGDSFDLMSDACTKFLNDFSILTADSSSLDKFWGVSYNLPRPQLPSSERLLTDDEYRVYLYLRNCRLLTREDILINATKCFGVDDYEIYFTEETNYLSATDHTIYSSRVTEESNLGKNLDDVSDDYVIDFADSDDDVVHLIEGGLSETSETIQVINIPHNSWDSEFLEYVSQFLSVKGNLKVREYQL